MKTPFPISIPLHTIHHQRIGGTESSLYNLAKGLWGTSAQLTVAYSDEERLAPEFRTWMKTSGVATKKTLRIPGPKSARFLEESIFEIGRNDESWVLYPNYFVPPAIGRRKPTAVLLHDIQYKVLPQYHSDRRRQWLDYYLPRMFERADVVFLISETERRQVFEYFGEACGQKCRVIYNAIDFDRFKGRSSDLAGLNQDDKPYILTVCHQFPHKNLVTLLQAFELVAQSDRNIQLFLVGRQSEENMQFVARSLSSEAAKRVRLLGFVSDAELSEYYRNAALFALPSLYEGFGMPAIEAMGLGVPTLLSGIPSLREITLDEASYISDPTNAKLWATGITELLSDSQYRARSVERSAKIRALYEPKKIAENLLSHLR